MSESGVDTLLIGIDAACRSILEPQFEAGSLPALRSIVDGGVTAPLESQLPPWTPSAWPSLYTGVNPGRHGVFSFLEYEGYDWDVVDATSVRASALWELLDHRDRSSVVVNVPVTSPPAVIDGAVVPGFVGPEDPPCHPEGLLRELREDVGDYRVYGDHEFADDPPVDERIAEYRSLVGMRGAAFRSLADRFDPDFGFVQFQQTDTVVHDFPGNERALHAVYEAVDEEVGAIVDACDPSTVFLASDHGIGPYAGHEFRVNEFLAREGYLETTRSDGDSPSWVPIWRDDLRDGHGGPSADGDGDGLPADGHGDGLSADGHGDDVATADREPIDGDSPVRTALERACTGILSRTGVTTDGVVDALERFGVAELAGRVAPDALLDTVEPGRAIDFRNSRAFVRLPVELGVRLNVAGREPHGMIDPAEYDAVRGELVERLRAVRTPDGDPVFEAVEPREAIYDGPHVERAPDVVTVPAAFEQFPAARLAGDVFGPMGEPWNHKRDGVFAAAGPAVDASASIDRAHLLDVAPTVLSAMGAPVAEQMEGTTLPVTAPGETLRYPDPDEPSAATTRARSAERSAGDTVTARLDSLGYIDNS